MKKAAILSAIAGLGAVAPLASAIDVKLVRVEDLALPALFSVDSDADPLNGIQTSQFYTGNGIASIAWDGDNLYIGGAFFGGESSPWLQVTRVNDVLGTRTFTALIDNTDPLNPTQDQAISTRRAQSGNGRGWTGMDYSNGTGVLMSFDKGSTLQGNQFMVWDVDTQITPFPVASTDSFNDPRGIAGPAFDNGIDGQGFDYDGDTVKDGPAALALDFASSTAGPFAASPLDLLFGDAPIYEPISPTGPILTGDPGLGGTIWRDIDVHPTTGLIAARAANDVLLATRSNNFTVATRTVVQGSEIPPANPAFVIGQNVEILHGATGGDLVAYVDRPSGAARSFADTIKFLDTAGNPVSINWLDSDDTPLTFGAGNDIPDAFGFYSLAWDESRSWLLVAGNQAVYFFEVGASTNPCPACTADWDGSGGAPNSSDFLAYLNDFVGQDACADLAPPGGDGAFTSSDFLAFLNAYSSGC